MSNDNEEIERKFPLVFTLNTFHHIGKRFIISLDPGVEIEQNESYFLVRLGIENDIGHNFYMMPTLFYDQRFYGFSTATIGLGVGHKF